MGAAFAAAEAGASATVVGRIGADAAGDLVLSQLAVAGVAAELVRDRDRPTGVAVAFPGSTVVAARGANAGFASEDVPEVIEGDALLVSGFALFQAGSSEAAAVAIERFTGPGSGSTSRHRRSRLRPATSMCRPPPQRPSSSRPPTRPAR